MSLLKNEDVHILTEATWLQPVLYVCSRVGGVKLCPFSFPHDIAEARSHHHDDDKSSEETSDRGSNISVDQVEPF